MLVNIAVAAPPYPASIKDGLGWIDTLSREAAESKAAIICFPESYLPGYPRSEFGRQDCSADELRAALQEACHIARQNAIALIIPMDWHSSDGLLNIAHVISATGEVLGYQTKNQLDPSEDAIWLPGNQRKVFEVDGLRFGISICHEGFRYPETVRWAARQGAQVVFHPNLTGSNTGHTKPGHWGSENSPYYEKAQMMRAIENTIYFATSNYALSAPGSASAIIDPEGNCLAYQHYGEPGVAVAEINTDNATGLLAKRFRAGLYQQ